MAQSSTEAKVGTKKYKLKPNNGYVVIKMDPGLSAKYGIILPSQAMAKYQGTTGIIHAIGGETLSDSPGGFPYKVGDKIIYSRYAGVQVNLEENFMKGGAEVKETVTYLILGQQEILTSIDEN